MSYIRIKSLYRYLVFSSLDFSIQVYNTHLKLIILDKTKTELDPKSQVHFFCVLCYEIKCHREWG